MAATSTLLIGNSGTGKSTACLARSRNWTEPIVVLNGDPKDYPGKRYKHCTVEDFPRKCHLIYDDLILPTPKQQKIIRELLTRDKRHENINIICAVHSARVNGLTSLLQQFDYLVFTNSEQNKQSWAYVAKTLLDRPDCMDEWDNFRSSGEATYLSVNTRTKETTIVSANGELAKTQSRELRQALVKYFRGSQAQKTDALLLFDYITEYINTSIVDSNLEMCVVGQKSGEVSRCHIFDFFTAVVTEGHKASECEIHVFIALVKVVKLPKSLIPNKFFHDFL